MCVLLRNDLIQIWSSACLQMCFPISQPRVMPSLCLHIKEFQHIYLLLKAMLIKRVHCVKSVQIRSFFWSVFSWVLTLFTQLCCWNIGNSNLHWLSTPMFSRMCFFSLTYGITQNLTNWASLICSLLTPKISKFVNFE